MMRRIIDARLIGANESEAMDIGAEHLRRESAGGSPTGYAAVERDDGSFEVNVAWQMRATTRGRASRNRWLNHSVKVVPA